jgi:hypothetical protein
VTTICAATLVFRGMSRAANHAVWLTSGPVAPAQLHSGWLRAIADRVMATSRLQDAQPCL